MGLHIVNIALVLLNCNPFLRTKGRSVTNSLIRSSPLNLGLRRVPSRSLENPLVGSIHFTIACFKPTLNPLSGFVMALYLLITRYSCSEFAGNILWFKRFLAVGRSLGFRVII